MSNPHTPPENSEDLLLLPTTQFQIDTEHIPWEKLQRWYEDAVAPTDKVLVNYMLMGNAATPIDYNAFDVRSFVGYLYALSLQGDAYFDACFREMYVNNFAPPRGHMPGGVSGLVPIYLAMTEEQKHIGTGPEQLTDDFSRFVVDTMMSECQQVGWSPVGKNFWAMIEQFPAFKEIAKQHSVDPDAIYTAIHKQPHNVIAFLLGLLHYHMPRFGMLQKKAANSWVNILKEVLAMKLSEMLKSGAPTDILKRVSTIPERVVLEHYAVVTQKQNEVRAFLVQELKETEAPSGARTSAILGGLKKLGASVMPVLHVADAVSDVYEMIRLVTGKKPGTPAEHHDAADPKAPHDTAATPTKPPTSGGGHGNTPPPH